MRETTLDFIDVVCDGSPGPTGGRFVAVEAPPGTPVEIGEWVYRDDGLVALRIPLRLKINRIEKIYEEALETLLEATDGEPPGKLVCNDYVRAVCNYALHERDVEDAKEEEE